MNTLNGTCAEVGLGKEFFVALSKNYVWTQKSELMTSNLVKSLVRFLQEEHAGCDGAEGVLGLEAGTGQ